MAKDQGFGRRPPDRDKGGANQHAEPTLSFAARARDGEPRGPGLGQDRRTKDETLTADADRPLYLSRDAGEERSSRAWIGIAVIAVAAGLGFYSWRYYTAPVTVEPMPVASTPSNPPADTSSSTTPSLAATPPADNANPAATPSPAQALSSVGQVATPNATDNAATTQPFSINSPATAGSAPPPKPASPPVKAAEAKPDTSDTTPPRKEASLDIAPPKLPRALPDSDKGLAPVKLTQPKPAMLTPPPQAAAPQPDLAQPDLAEPALPTPAPSVATATTAPRSFDNGPTATGRPLPLSPTSLSRTSLPADNAAPTLRAPNTVAPGNPIAAPSANDNAPAPGLQAPASLPAMAAPPADQPNTVTVDGITYVNGQQPHALGTLSSSEPPAASDGSGAPPLPTIDVPSGNRAVPYTPPADASTPLPNDVVIGPNGQMTVPAGQQ